ncbi:MAG: hypothetical protein [Wendovervirus sonii]|uniref:Nicotinamidase n=1 Tax=phage Lak_Megaphage_Sonny TaxID=3109229 RepID=A0ABZ0Z2G5_9CAUD|nr:MAG: hypothetical protein [phage Lak_Megaphage_Sonny]
MKKLIIVDFQYDFCEPNGSLYVPGAEKAKENIINAINSGIYDEIVMTVDWHTIKDKSFKCNGGQWPVHCVQFSHGAAIDQDIMASVIYKNIPYCVIKKGMNSAIEEYGAFSKFSKINDADNADGCIGYAFCEEPSDDAFCFHKNIEYDICGLAGDYCVFETYKNICKLNGINVTPLYDCMAFIGDPFNYNER